MFLPPADAEWAAKRRAPLILFVTVILAFLVYGLLPPPSITQRTAPSASAAWLSPALFLTNYSSIFPPYSRNPVYLFYERSRTDPSVRPLRLWVITLWNTDELRFNLQGGIGPRLTADDVVYIRLGVHKPHARSFVDYAPHLKPEHVLRASPCELVVLANARDEFENLNKEGVRAIWVHHNAFLDERKFTLNESVPEAARIYDLFVNSRFDKNKRTELAGDVELAAFIGYRIKGGQGPPAAFLSRVINARADGSFVVLKPEEVNGIMQQSKLGGIFSAEEGGNRATTEYMLAGLPVVSTPSAGGRDSYFDDTNSIIVEPTRAAVKAGVAAGLARLRDGTFDRRKIREGALARSAAFRAEFLRDISRVLRERGVPPSEETAEGIYSKAWRPQMFPPGFD